MIFKNREYLEINVLFFLKYIRNKNIIKGKWYVFKMVSRVRDIFGIKEGFLKIWIINEIGRKVYECLDWGGGGLDFVFVRFFFFIIEYDMIWRLFSCEEMNYFLVMEFNWFNWKIIFDLLKSRSI